MEVTGAQVALTIAAALLSGVFGVAISTIYYRRYEKRRQKLDTVRRLFGYRYNILGEGFTVVLNEVFVVFHDSQGVMKALSEFHTMMMKPKAPETKGTAAALCEMALANDKLVTLLKALCGDVGIQYKQFNDLFFLSPFNPDPRTTRTR